MRAVFVLDDVLKLTPVRQELLNWFRESAPSLAPAYEGAMRLLAAETFPGRIHFIAHAGRDICDRLVFVLDPQLEGKRVQYEDEMDKICDRWPALASLSEAERNIAEGIQIPLELALRIESLVEQHRSRRKRPSNQELLFQFLRNKDPAQGDVNKRLVGDFKRIRDRFMRWTHLRKKECEVSEIELQAQFESFESMLHSFVGKFFTSKKELDEVLQQANQ